MCCGGRVFGYVKITGSNSTTFLESAGFGLEKDDTGNSYFSQPCVAHRANCCTVYENRPRVCAKFHCKLLDNYLAGEIGFDLAIKVVEECKQLASELEKSEYYGATFQKKLVSARLSELNRKILEENDATLRRAYAAVAIRAFALNEIIEANFNPAGKR
jgi:hypothetical protein